MASTTAQPTSSKRSLLFAATIGAIIAAVVNVVIYLIGDSAGVTFMVPAGGPGGEPMELPIFAIVLVSAVPAFIAVGLINLLRRFAGQRAMMIFYVLAIIVLALSFAPFTQEGMAAEAVPYLAVMHVVAAGAIVGSFAYFKSMGSSES